MVIYMKKILSKVKLRNMLLIIAFITVGTVAGLSVYLWHMAKDLSAQVSIMYDGPVMSSSFAQSAKVNFLKYDSSVRKLFLCESGDKGCDPNSTVYGNHLENMTSDLGVVSERSLSPANPKIVEEVKDKVGKIEEFRKDLVGKKSGGAGSVTVFRLWDGNEIRKFIEDKLENATDNEAEIGFDRRQEIEKKSAAKLKTSMIVLALGIGIAFLISFLTASAITSPIVKLAETCLSFAKGDYACRANVVGSPEIMFLGDSFNEMASQVENRNQQLKVEHQKTANLLNNMRQSLFTVIADGTVIGPVSKYSEKVFGENIEGKKIIELLYRDIPHDSEVFATLKTAFSVVFGEGELQWGFMEEAFPSRVIRQSRKGDDGAEGVYEQILKVSVIPLWDENFLLEKLMFIVEDVTELETLTRRAAIEKEKSERNMRMVQELLQSSRGEVKKCLSDSSDMLGELFNMASKNSLSKDELDLMFRHLHTIKGNSRVFKLSGIAQVGHSVEDQFIKMKTEVLDNKRGWNEFSAEFIFALNGLQETQESYSKIYSELFDSSQNPANMEGFIAKDRIKDVMKRIDDLLAKESPAVTSLIKTELSVFFSSSLSDSLKAFNKMIQDFAQSNNKKIDYVCSGDDCLIKEDQLKLIKDAVMHMLRNSIDHGIESLERRAQLHKPEIAVIEASIKLDESDLIISIRDDGKGLDGDIIGAAALRKNLVTEAQLAAMNQRQKIELIFLPGFSTKEQVTDISGRGVGMDVVATNVKSINGRTDIQTEIDKGTTFIITIPRIENI